MGRSGRYSTSTSSAVPGRLAVVGDDNGENVAEIARASAFRNEDGPVLVNDPDLQLPRHVGPGEHRDDTRDGGRRGGVDAHDVGPCVGRQVKSGVEHARRL